MYCRNSGVAVTAVTRRRQLQQMSNCSSDEHHLPTQGPSHRQIVESMLRRGAAAEH